MKTQMSDTGAPVQTENALKPWTAPKLEELAAALNTLSAGNAGAAADGGAASMNTSKT